MDNEFYFEESNPKKAKLIFVGIIILISLLCIVLVFVREKYTLHIKKDITLEVGEKLNKDISLYVSNKVIDKGDYSVFLTSIPVNEDGILNKTGEYSISVRYKNITKKGKVKVVDKTAPIVEVTDLMVGVNEDYYVDDFITKCEDYSMPCKVTYEKESDENLQKKEGKYTFKIVVSDNAGNKVKKEVNLEVKEGYNRIKSYESDLHIDHIDPVYDDWKEVMVIKLDKGYDPEEIDETEAYGKLMEVTSGDYHKYLDPIYQNNEIVSSDLIEVYNKYDLIIGYAIRVKLDNGLILYLREYE